MQIAELNALGSLRHLLRSYKVSFSSLVVLSDDELQLFLEGKLNVARRSAKSVPYIKALGLGIPGRICLVCMENGMVTPHYFNYLLSLICPIHGVTLLELCDKCDAPILYTRTHRLRCGKCRGDFRDSEPKLAADWEKEFRRRFSPSEELGFCSVKSHSDLAITRLLLWHHAPRRYRSSYNYPHLGLRRHPWLASTAYMSDDAIEQIVIEFRNKHPRHVDELVAWTRCPTPVNSIVQRVLGNQL